MARHLNDLPADRQERMLEVGGRRKEAQMNDKPIETDAIETCIHAIEHDTVIPTHKLCVVDSARAQLAALLSDLADFTFVKEWLDSEVGNGTEFVKKLKADLAEKDTRIAQLEDAVSEAKVTLESIEDDDAQTEYARKLIESALSDEPSNLRVVTDDQWREFANSQHALGYRDAHLTILNQGKRVVTVGELKEMAEAITANYSLLSLLWHRRQIIPAPTNEDERAFRDAGIKYEDMLGRNGKLSAKIGSSADGEEAT